MLRTFAGRIAVLLLLAVVAPASSWAQPAQPAQTQTGQGLAVHAGGEANLVVPDLSVVEFGGINGRSLLMGGLVVCALGLLFGLTTFTGLKNLPVHSSMREVSELIYETCKTYLLTQGRFILILVGLHRGDHGGLLRLAEPDPRKVDRAQSCRSSCCSR